MKSTGQAFLLPPAFSPDMEKKISMRWVASLLGSLWETRKRQGHSALVLSSPWTQDKQVWHHLPSHCPPLCPGAPSNPSRSALPAPMGPTTGPGYPPVPKQPCHILIASRDAFFSCQRRRSTSGAPIPARKPVPGRFFTQIIPKAWLKFTALSPGQPSRQSLSPSPSNAEQ